MKVDVLNTRDKQVILDTNTLVRRLNRELRPATCTVNVVLVDDGRIRGLNRQFLKELSAATTRWLVSCDTAGQSRSPGNPRWTVQLLRNKAAPLIGDEKKTWQLEWDHDQGVVRPSSDVVGGPDKTTDQATAQATAAGKPSSVIRRSA